MDTSDSNSTATNNNNSSSSNSRISSSSSSSSGGGIATAVATAAATAAAGASSVSSTAKGGAPFDAPPVQRPLQRPQSLESARREALGYLLSADAAFMRAEPEYRQCSDNHAHVCLDAAWLLFLTGDMTNLPQVLPLSTEPTATALNCDIIRLSSS
jgi:hypothetical protein